MRCLWCVLIGVLLLSACGGGGTGSDGNSPMGNQPTATPEPDPTAIPTLEPTVLPSDEATPEPTADPLVWPVENGRFGTPQETFTLPGPSASGGLYLMDVQASFPEVNWQTLDRLYIPAGHYKFIRLGNLPERTSDKPLVITNINGQVRVGGLDHYYLFVLSGGSNWILTGRYDPESGTGHSDFPGHRGGRFAHSQDTYGLMVDDDFVRDSVSGLGVSGATDFEIEFIEIKEVGFAGMSLKTDDAGEAHMSNVKLHDNYIHDTGSEGLYIGSTQAQPQHQIRDWQIYNNRILRTGTEAIQLGQLAGHTRVHNNVFGPAAIDWRAAFQAWQDNNFQIGLREGYLEVSNNIFIGSAGSMISFFAQDIAGDAGSENQGATFTNNYFTGIRNLGMYINNVVLPNMTYRFENNVFANYRFDRDQVYEATPYNHLLRVVNTTTPLVLEKNTWQGPENFSNLIGNNGVSGNVSSSDNQNDAATNLQFVNSGLPDNFNYLDLEMWAAIETRGDNQPVAYPLDTIVMHLGLPYKCQQNPCPGGTVPPQNPEIWTARPVFSDDVRILPGSDWQTLGLQPN
ncbi:hypothetical protein P886_4107 [Alteromonadaceae bacterium 2753L.S.0a.02]|nr:hypothetical protein P886_4107 [Alteromonadaceae bacterium 2753L.S.0a.02]